MTPHINAKKGDIAKKVIMPGDPLRAKKIAETFLTDVKLVNELRNMFMYTGKYKGMPVTIAGSGMGVPSIGIYSHELYHFYDVDMIIRVGTTGSLREEIKVGDLYNVKEAYTTDTNYAKIMLDIDDKILPADEKLFNVINETAKAKNIPMWKGRVNTSEAFYRPVSQLITRDELGIDASEMEALLYLQMQFLIKNRLLVY